MLAPETYTGYDKDNNCLGSACYDANEYINPDSVKAAIDKINSTVENEMKSVSSSLKGLIDDANDAVIVQGTKMGPTIEALCGTIESISGSVADNLSKMYDEAVNAHDRIQTQLNDRAKAEVRGLSGFDHFG